MKIKFSKSLGIFELNPKNTNALEQAKKLASL